MSNDYENVFDLPSPAQREAIASADADHQRVAVLFATRADGWRAELIEYLDRTNPKRVEARVEHIPAPVDRAIARYTGPEDTAPPQISTGFPDLDRLVTFSGGDLVVVGARSSHGKSALALQFAINVAQFSGYASLFFATEMSSEQMAMRALCMLAGVDSRRVRRREIGLDERVAMHGAHAKLSASLAWITDENGLDVASIRERSRAAVKRIERECGRAVKLIVVDYLQRVRAGRACDRNANREQQVAAVAYELKEMARELNVCVVVPAQLNADGDKRGDDARPRSSDLRESKGVEHEADTVILVHNPHYVDREQNPNRDTSKAEACELIVAKGRNDGTGTVPVWFTPMFTRFTTMSEQEKYDRLKRQVPR